jgi:hypothetical protein
MIETPRRAGIQAVRREKCVLVRVLIIQRVYIRIYIRIITDSLSGIHAPIIATPKKLSEILIGNPNEQ